MAKRGSSGLSLLIAIDKPKGMTSHDVVNRTRRVFNEKRVGHTGTLDPLASGVLCVAVGPATRLDAFLSGHDKTYVMDVAFGAATETDDAEGVPILAGEVPQELFDVGFASDIVAGLVGKSEQVPPRYSAIKVNGQKSYAAARKGSSLELKPRVYEVHSARLENVSEASLSDLLQNPEDPEAFSENDSLERKVPVWRVIMEVSGGTYMRSIARDLGERFGCGAFVSDLRRVAVGSVRIEDCSTLDRFEQEPRGALVDPLRLLEIRAARISDTRFVAKLENGNSIPASALSLEQLAQKESGSRACRTAQLEGSSVQCFDGEVVAVLADNRIKALYSFDAANNRFMPCCVFPVGVERGSDI